MAAFGGYSTGVASVAAGSKTVTLAGGYTATMEAGDPFYAGNGFGLIDSITDATHFQLALPWNGASLVNSDYLVPYLSVTRYQNAYAAKQVRDLITILDGAGVIYYVPDGQTEPDVSIGEEGQFAIRIVPGAAWTFWVKEQGVWVNLGAPLGVAWRAIWAPDSAYITNDITSRLGVLYIAKQSGTNHPPESSPSYWDVLLQGGNLFPLLWSDSDMPASGETILKFPMPVPVSFPAGMALSRAIADVAPATTAVFSLKKNGVEFATYSFAPGQKNATFSCPVTINFLAGDVYSEVAPAPRDATLSGVSSTKIGYR